MLEENYTPSQFILMVTPNAYLARQDQEKRRKRSKGSKGSHMNLSAALYIMWIAILTAAYLMQQKMSRSTMCYLCANTWTIFMYWVGGKKSHQSSAAANKFR
eukprot:scaffold12957_cov148-Skeletonema_marinoi.AAC.9